MIRLVLHPRQRDLLPGLLEVFPDLYQDKYAQGVETYSGTFGEGAQRIRQQEFLYQHKVAYTDVTVEQQRTRLIQSFFHGVELNGYPIIDLNVRPILSTLNYHAATLRNDEEDEEVILRFPPSWTPILFQQENDYLGWVYVSVYDGGTIYEAAFIGTEQRVIEVLKRTATEDKMLAWLEQGGYTQTVCTTLAPSVVGLYKRG